MTVSLIAAVAENNAIGKDNDLIWHLPKDLKYFKEVTEGHPVIMGRKNYISIPEKYRPLPNRPNLVVTRDPNFSEDNIAVFNSIEYAINFAKTCHPSEVFIIGGGEIYAYCLAHKLCQKLYITEVKSSFKADVFFPEIDTAQWQEVSRIPNKADDKNPYDFDYVVYDLIH